MVGGQLREAGFTACVPGRLTGVDRENPPSMGKTGQRCLLLGSGPDAFAFVCLVETDSLGRAWEVLITNDSRYDCEPDLDKK